MNRLYDSDRSPLSPSGVEKWRVSAQTEATFFTVHYYRDGQGTRMLPSGTTTSTATFTAVKKP
jgi:hypothetical protein